jgi:hypothetical protein
MMPFTAAKLGAVQGSAIVIVGERWEGESALPVGPRGSDSDSGNPQIAAYL